MDSLGNIIDLSEWNIALQKLSEITNLPLTTIDVAGEEIASAGTLPFYAKLVQKSQTGRDSIRTQTLEAIKAMHASRDKLLQRDAGNGLLAIWAPIIIDSKLRGLVGCTTIKEEQNVGSTIPQFAQHSSLDTDELQDAFAHIEPTSTHNITIYSAMLFTLAKTVPILVHGKKQGDRRISDLSTIYNISKLVNEPIELESMLQKVISFVMNALPLHNVIITTLSRKDIQKHVMHKHLEGADQLQSLVLAESLSTNNQVRIANIQQDYRFVNQDSVKKHTQEAGITALVSYPLMVRKEVVGLLSLYASSPDIFSQRDMSFLSVISDQVAMAVFNAKTFETVKEHAIIDNLTGLHNRHHFMDALENKLIPSITSKKPLSVALLDVDDFKQYNDTHGHLKGDELLKQISDLLKQEVRSTDIVGRYGGEEFIILFPGQDGASGLSIIHRINQAIAKKRFEGHETQPQGAISLSCGLITCLDVRISTQQLLEEADKLLYESKRSGKNKVTSGIIVDKHIPLVKDM